MRKKINKIYNLLIKLMNIEEGKMYIYIILLFYSFIWSIWPTTQIVISFPFIKLSFKIKRPLFFVLTCLRIIHFRLYPASTLQLNPIHFERFKSFMQVIDTSEWIISFLKLFISLKELILLPFGSRMGSFWCVGWFLDLNQSLFDLIKLFSKLLTLLFLFVYENLIPKGLIHLLTFHQSYFNFLQLIIFLINMRIKLVDFLEKRVDLKIFLQNDSFHRSDFFIWDI